MLGEPFVQIKEEILLGPEHAGHGLAHDQSFILGDLGRRDLAIELVRFPLTGLQGRGKAAEGIADSGGRHVRQAQTDGGGLSRTHLQVILCRGFGSHLGGVHPAGIALDDIVVDSVFDVWGVVGSAEDALVVGLVFRE